MREGKGKERSKIGIEKKIQEEKRKKEKRKKKKRICDRNFSFPFLSFKKNKILQATRPNRASSMKQIKEESEKKWHSRSKRSP